MHTDDTLVDGLEADIAMKGSVNLVRRDLNMEAVVAPEISATVGVVAAFAVNPIVGAAVFAASKVLGPLWAKSPFCAITFRVRWTIRKSTKCCDNRVKKKRNDLTRARNCPNLI